MPTTILKIENASVVRGGRRILNNISLKIADGEHVAIIGPNGSGKSTLIKLITRQIYPLAGANEHPVVELFSKDRWDVFALRSMMGILSADLHQSFTNDTDRTGLESVLSGFFASQGIAGHHIVTGEMRQLAEAALALADAVHLRDMMLAVMSTGEARRVLIARALVSDPRALLLDEPTTGLDLRATKHFLATIRDIARAGKTILLVTHHVEEIIPEIDRVILMKSGSVFRDGSKDEILTGENLSALFDEPIELRRKDGFYSASS